MSVLITLIIIAAVALIIPKIVGYEIYGVLSGSMEPVYSVGGVVYVKRMDPDIVMVGDTITFHIESNDKVVASHRVIQINHEEQTFITKGDANEVVDAEPVSFNRLIGRVDFYLPYLGYIAMYIQTKQGIIASVGVFLFIIFLSLLDDIFKKESSIKDKSPKQVN